MHPAVASGGEKRALRSGLVSLAAGLALVAVAHSWFLLVPALALVTLGSGLATPTLAAMIADRGGSERRGSTLGVAQSAGALARVVGPIYGGALFEHVGVGAPYAVGAVVVLLAIGLL